jgi:hypothetical protein
MTEAKFTSMNAIRKGIEQNPQNYTPVFLAGMKRYFRERR